MILARFVDLAAGVLQKLWPLWAGVNLDKCSVRQPTLEIVYYYSNRTCSSLASRRRPPPLLADEAILRGNS